MTKAVVLLSGGPDSTTTLAIAKRDGFGVYALLLRCGQTHAIGLDTARRVAAALGARVHAHRMTKDNRAPDCPGEVTRGHRCVRWAAAEVRAAMNFRSGP